jgi:hypothetical protein
MALGDSQKLEVNGAAVTITGNGTWQMVDRFRGVPQDGMLTLCTGGGSELKLDGLVVIPDGQR